VCGLLGGMGVMGVMGWEGEKFEKHLKAGFSNPHFLRSEKNLREQ